MAVDVAVLTYSGESLKVLVVRHRLGSLIFRSSWICLVIVRVPRLLQGAAPITVSPSNRSCGPSWT
ncbi:hypothetical protein ABT116_46980, partial [Streptomyces sp. NPDC002130]|uniref:hypothetical protein n=1 Tax=Streptomyces sp. NPDC002130 TaxID=3155568 RepID=UPI003326F990